MCMGYKLTGAAPVSCCDESTAHVPDRDVSRRSLFKGAAMLASVVPGAAPGRAHAQGKRIQLAYCSQLLCGVPYEVARAGGFFRQQGLDVEFVYTRGGSAAMQALVGGVVDYAATALDVAIQAYANAGADIRRFAVTGRLPLFAVVTAPTTASTITTIKQLEGRTVGISALANADHALTLYLLKQAGADPAKVRFATMGVNLLEALRQGQIDVGLVQEPALTVLRRAGARVLVNGMDMEDAKRFLGGAFEFMGIAVRTREIERRRPEMVALVTALTAALKAVQTMSGADVAGAFPKAMTTGLDLKEFADIIAQHRASLYPDDVAIDLEAAKRVEQSLRVGGLLKPGASMAGLHDSSVAGG
jgi:sulfonate transport system substrate-binding protein